MFFVVAVLVVGAAVGDALSVVIVVAGDCAGIRGVYILSVI